MPKLGKPHLIGSFILLAGSIVYNVYVFTKPRGAELPNRREMPTQGTRVAAAPSPGPSGVPAVQVDPIEIPPPPSVDLTAEPTFERDPFVRPGERRETGTQTSAGVSLSSAPVVRSILFSPQRRLALVDGRVVGIGDELPSGVVADIVRDAVIIRLPSGELQRWPLKRPLGLERAK